MAARGQKLKEGVIKAILEAFPNNTFYDETKKEVRFEGTEDGTPIQIKISFTAAKDLISKNFINNNSNKEEIKEKDINEVTKEEKQNVEHLLHSLGY